MAADYGERRNDGREVGRIEPDLENDAVGSWNLYGPCSMEVDEPIRMRFPFCCFTVVEPDGIEPTTSSMPLKRSPN